MDSGVQRRNMVESQVRPSDVTDRRIARAMLEVPREAFVPAERRAVAYMDGNLALGKDGQAQRSLLSPRTLAKLLQALSLEADAAVLDVAPATGYSTAVLARIVRKVVAVESDPALANVARTTLAEVGASNAEVVVGPMTGGHEAAGPYDSILIGGKIADAPASLLNQLKDGGCLIAIRDVGGVGQATEWRRFAMSFDRRALFDAEAPMLPGFGRRAEFVL